ncbi:M15 family metallopeptidase [Actinotalea sp. M2MS4P-6]|uniref:M15 family metallopeptidase n=1 Tax=Actinotalea sp. M2MS4P-6 TaxID=2983762 RepID=UPI0021E486EF|nr:M15 family metallopeptidase [Actinotalea sp. M2MS4P-6]MCV2394154.1 M15 family metallopeptidase [Actinotalea sp. M2MS4P-6]
MSPVRWVAVVVTLALAGCTWPGTASVDSSAPASPAGSTGVSQSTAVTGSASAAASPRASAQATSPAVPPASGTEWAGDVPPTRPRGAGATGASIIEIGPALAARMSSSWRPGCPVPLADLRYVRVPYLDPDGRTRVGELVVHADQAEAIAGVFLELWRIGYPIASMRLVDDFGGSDDASMAADNTSAFNCRPITGGTAWSEHAYGRALDLNPVENPYVRGRHVAPDAGSAFVDRPDEPMVLHAGDPVVEAFAAAGWLWGGEWTGGVLDYQHFSVTGR